ncbi:glycosyltransferase 87 family protein [Actinoplanes sp. NPDC049265]|uniref:glycosyltransferase 87 family protein n=1 Tax=Actinoplanes sp. NPDC049265 TaxID=3363902 RepID=UPI003711B786
MTRLLARADAAAGGRALDAALYALSGAFALFTALASTLLPHRAWGSVAAWGYLAALLLVPFVNRLLLTWATFAAVSLLPLVVQAVQRAGGRLDRAQEEVVVVEEMGRHLASTGSPYLSRAGIAALPASEQLGGYHPYQPGMAVFGLPRAWLGDHWFTDSRVWFAVVMVAAVAWAASTVRAVQAATVFPVCALTLATGGDDLPVLALCLLALAFCARNRFGAAGLAVGAAAAMKPFAFPVVGVLLVLAVVNGQWRRYLPGAIGLPVITLLPALLVDADAYLENVIRFPTGHGLVTSPAQSPFPGYLIATSVPGGRYVALGLLVLAGLTIAALLLRRPPRTAAAAALFCGYGLLTAILLMPTTRFGYLLYPVALLVWAAELSRPTGTTAPRSDTALYRQ